MSGECRLRNERRRPRPSSIFVLLIAVAAAALASETDNLTYRYIPLEDSAPKLNAVLNTFLEKIAAETNEALKAKYGDPARGSDTEVELRFVRTYLRSILQRLDERLIQLLGRLNRRCCVLP